jgi:glycosyltransferase involved in cell wall biosynthesis
MSTRSVAMTAESKQPSGRPRVLFICQRNPWRLDNGGIIRNYWLIHALSGRFDIDLVTADDDVEPVPADFRARCADIHRFSRPTGMRAKLTRAAGAMRLGGTFFTSGNVTRKMRTGVAGLVATRDYCAVLTELGLVDAVPAGKVPVIYSAHNCEAALLLRRAKLEPVLSRLLITIDALRLRRLEARLIERAAFVTPCSQNDVDDMRKFAPSIDTKAVVIPNGVDCATYADVAAAEGKPGVILVTGSFDWLPNRRGLMWFIKEVLPILEQSLAGRDFSIRIAGRMSAEFAKKLDETSPHVVAAPNVPRMDVELRAASVVAVPVIASSGTRLRILEAWAAGRPVVTTPHGAFGLDHIDGSDLFSCESPQRFAEAAVRLLDDPGLRARLKTAGLERAASYDWCAIGGKLVAALETFGLTAPAGREPKPTIKSGA